MLAPGWNPELAGIKKYLLCAGTHGVLSCVVEDKQRKRGSEPRRWPESTQSSARLGFQERPEKINADIV